MCLELAWQSIARPVVCPCDLPSLTLLGACRSAIPTDFTRSIHREPRCCHAQYRQGTIDAGTDTAMCIWSHTSATICAKMTLLNDAYFHLRRRFETAGDRCGQLSCTMIDRSDLCSVAAPERHNAAARSGLPLVAGGGSVSRLPRVVHGEIEGGRVRDWQCYGGESAWTAYDLLACDAGQLLLSFKSRPASIARATLTVSDDSERWLWALFDLAWDPAEGSPLVVSKMVWAQNTFLFLDQLPALRKQINPSVSVRRALAQIPDPPDAFSSTIDDLFSSSCYAIDRLLIECAKSLSQPAEPGGHRTKKRKKSRRRYQPTNPSEPRLVDRQTWLRYQVLRSHQQVADELRIAKSTSYERCKKVDAFVAATGGSKKSIRASVSLESRGTDAGKRPLE